MLAVPVIQPVVIEQLNALVDDERHDAKPQALLEHNKPPDAAVSVLERVYLFESRVEFHDVLEGFRRAVFVIRKEPANFHVDIPRERGNFAADLVRLFLVVPDREPCFPAVGSSGFQNPVKLLDERFGQLFTAVLDDEVNTAEVVGRFDDVVHVDSFVFQNADRVGFKDVSRLVCGQPAALDVVGIVGQLHLYLVVDTAFAAALHFVRENLSEGGGRFLCRHGAHGSSRVLGDIPCLSGQERALYAPLRAVIPDAAFGQVPQFRGLLYGYIYHALNSLWILYTVIGKKSRALREFIC